MGRPESHARTGCSPSSGRTVDGRIWNPWKATREPPDNRCMLCRPRGCRHPMRAYQRAVKYLLSTQQEDGWWFVRTRAMAFQPYFDAGFPHGFNQVDFGRRNQLGNSRPLAGSARAHPNRRQRTVNGRRAVRKDRPVLPSVWTAKSKQLNPSAWGESSTRRMDEAAAVARRAPFLVMKSPSHQQTGDPSSLTPQRLPARSNWFESQLATRKSRRPPAAGLTAYAIRPSPHHSTCQ